MRVFEEAAAVADGFVDHDGTFWQHGGNRRRETFRCRDQEMRRSLPKPDPLRRGCIARPQMNAEFFLESHPRDRRAKVFVDVIGESAQGRDINAMDRRPQRAGFQFPQE